MEHTYNPIQELPSPRIGLFQAREAPEPGFALVVHREGRPLMVLRPPNDRLTLGEVLVGSIRKIYRVDVSQHTLELQCHLPADTDAFHFFATVHVKCEVIDPKVVVDRRLNDVRTALEPVLVETMRAATRKFSVEESAEAELEVTQALRERERTHGLCPGLRVTSVAVRLDLEEAARKHVRALKEAQRRHREEVEKLGHDKELVGLQSEVARLRAQLDIVRSKEYLPLIQEGNWSLMALHLAQHPDDVSGVIQVMMGQQQTVLDRQLAALRLLLKEDVVEASQFGDAGKRLLATVFKQLTAGTDSLADKIEPTLGVTGDTLDGTPENPSASPEPDAARPSDPDEDDEPAR